MLRYQFAPFIAYFHSGKVEDLITLTEYALKITPNAEEAYLWHGWAMYRKGDIRQALADFEQALVENPNYLDAQYALDFVRQNQ
jgi:tetratricopeptide (TPR) repeat protein